MKRMSFVCVSFIVLHIILGWLPSVSYAQYKIISWTIMEILPGKIDSAPYLFLLYDAEFPLFLKSILSF